MYMLGPLSGIDSVLNACCVALKVNDIQADTNDNWVLASCDSVVCFVNLCLSQKSTVPAITFTLALRRVVFVSKGMTVFLRRRSIPTTITKKAMCLQHMHHDVPLWHFCQQTLCSMRRCNIFSFSGGILQPKVRNSATYDRVSAQKSICSRYEIFFPWIVAFASFQRI